ncbi:MAG: tRNA (uridine(34)/cytosine(34)/5-carboxymethylaminomethyluridine(34)-2'-O)-methyltransferase TrmL [Elusimicrobia bacterium RIFCSPLOWO2_01_FULL_60_11]|nr:MAG: tRNA (uridine(34)/cytosine(34)/5-carboxymethylaminomethyluridine(34)-2'-O)-methyltransferase TrmL [Elusimicrobia bacterium RIFCSPLOWO2_01_FULL_60_11]
MSASGVHVVLVEPEIPGNTGNVGRTCVATGSALHLVGRLGFSLDDKYLKRSGLDYWPNVDLKIHKDWDSFLETLPEDARLYFFEKDGPRNFWDAEFAPESYLVFGSETSGFSKRILEENGDLFIRIPMTGPVRSLNLSSSAAVAVYEALRQMNAVVVGNGRDRSLPHR